jgi:putative ABC transport system substrate-binding protein
MRRREFLAWSTLAGLVPSQARAQPRRMARLGYLSPSAPPDPNVDSFRAGMGGMGYVEGSDYSLELRYAGRAYSRFPTLVQELLAAKVDLIVTGGAATRAAPFAAQTVPVVFGFSGDPVDAGIVASYGRPGGNATGSPCSSSIWRASAWNCSRRLHPRLPASRSWPIPTIPALLQSWR